MRFKNWKMAVLAAMLTVSSAAAVFAEETPEPAKTKEEMDARFSYQEEIKDALKEEQAAHYSMEDALIVVDPFELSPLTAVAVFSTEDPTRISVKVKGDNEAATLTHDYEEMTTDHMVPIYGLYAGRENEVELVATTEDGTETSFTYGVETDVLPDDISKTEVSVSIPEKMQPGLTFFDCPHIGGNYELAVDCNGDIRWYYSDKNLNGSVMLTHLKDGNMLLGTGEKIPDAYNNLYGFYELTPAGQFVRSYQVYGTHHDIRETENGNLIVLASVEGRESQNDYAVEIDRETGEVVRDWDFMEIIPMNEYDTQDPYTGGLSNWMHNNAIWYDEENGDIIASGRHQNMILKFDADTKEIKWILSATVAERNPNLDKYMLTPIGDDFEYPTSQHAATLAADGDLLVFDNRNFDEVDEDGNLDQNKLYSRAVKYHIDEENMTVEQVWEYGKDEGNQLYSSFGSDVDSLGENHYLIDFGGMYIAEDGSSYDHILTDKEIKNASNRNSIAVELVDDEVVFQVKLYGNSQSQSYKAERKDVYQNAKEIELS